MTVSRTHDTFKPKIIISEGKEIVLEKESLLESTTFAISYN